MLLGKDQSWELGVGHPAGGRQLAGGLAPSVQDHGGEDGGEERGEGREEGMEEGGENQGDQDGH